MASDFDAMRACPSRYGAPEAFLYAFEVLELDGQNMRTRSWAAGRCDQQKPNGAAVKK